MATLQELLHTETVRAVVSRIKTPMSRFQQHYGVGIGGPHTNAIPGREFSYDIFDRTREIATGRAPGAPAARVKLNPVGRVSGMCYRTHEAKHILLDKVYRNRRLGGGFGEVDRHGENYITRQETTLAQRFKNSREFMLNAMFMNNGFSIRIDGDDMIPVAKGSGSLDIDFQVPAGNIGTVGGIFAGDWQTSATAVLVEEMMALNAYSEELTGYPIKDCWVNSTTAAKILKIDEVQNLGGTANTVFNNFERSGFTSEDGIGDTGLTFTLRAIPWLTFHAYDAGLVVDGTYTKFIPDHQMLCTPEPDGEWLEMLEGTEVQRETNTSPLFDVTGFGSWTSPCTNPPAEELFAVDNAIPSLRIPKAIFRPTVSA